MPQSNRNLFDSDDKYSLLASLEDEYIDSKDQRVKYKNLLAFEKALVRPGEDCKSFNGFRCPKTPVYPDGRGLI